MTDKEPVKEHAKQTPMEVETPQDPTEQWKQEVMGLTEDEVKHRIKIFENNERVMNNEMSRVKRECTTLQKEIKDNNDKIQRYKQLPYLVSNIMEILELEPEEDMSGTMDYNA